MKWTNAFLNGTSGAISRASTLADYLQEGDKYTVVTDASLDGLGAFLVVNHIIEEYALGRITNTYEEVLKPSRVARRASKFGKR